MKVFVCASLFRGKEGLKLGLPYIQILKIIMPTKKKKIFMVLSMRELRFMKWYYKHLFSSYTMYAVFIKWTKSKYLLFMFFDLKYIFRIEMTLQSILLQSRGAVWLKSWSVQSFTRSEMGQLPQDLGWMMAFSSPWSAPAGLFESFCLGLVPEMRLTSWRYARNC